MCIRTNTTRLKRKKPPEMKYRKIHSFGLEAVLFICLLLAVLILAAYMLKNASNFYLYHLQTLFIMNFYNFLL